MALSILPTATELGTLTSLPEVRAWSGTPEATWKAASTHLGEVTTLRLLALTPMDVYRTMLDRVRIPVTRPAGATTDPPPRAATAVEVIQLAVMWRVARLAFSLPDIDILAPYPAGNAQIQAAGAPLQAVAIPKVQKVKMSVHLDQMDENEVELVSRTVLEECYRCYRETTGSDPLPEADPTMEQVSAMRAKVIDRQESPYADFSVLVPYGKELQKNMKARSWLLQEDGSFKGIDIPGPPGYSAWLKCWRVYRTVLLMLRHAPVPPHGPKPVVTIACLEEYADKISELCAEFPECWHLVWQAEDRCRRDELERIRRSLVRARIEGNLPMNIRFDPDQPWVGVFTYAARDGEYWAKHVTRPAQTFLARGGSGRKMTREAAESVMLDKDMVKITSGGGAGVQGEPGQGQSRNARKRRAEKQRQDEARKWSSTASKGGWENSASSWAPKGSGKTQSQKGMHPRKYGQTFVTTREGDEICYKFSKGAPGACSEPCVDGRTHCCQYCLGAHPNQQCQKRDGKSKGGGGKNPGK